MAIKEKPLLPIFSDYTIDELHKRLYYSEIYLLEMKSGKKRASERFRNTACGILNRSEADLFGGDSDG